MNWTTLAHDDEPNEATAGTPTAAPKGDNSRENRPSAPATVVLVGNPNVGKSVLFKNLTGRFVTISNFPGTTVEITRAVADSDGRRIELFDTPGVNDLTQPGEEARVTREVVAQADDAVLLQVADAKNLRRALLLTLQLAASGRRLVLALNMMDELERRGARIDLERLAAILGVPVVGTVAVRRRGTRELVEALSRARVPRIDGPPLPASDDGATLNAARLEQVNRIMARTYELEQPARPRFGVRLGFWAMHPVKGLFMLAAVLVAVFWFVGLVGAGSLVDLLDGSLFRQRINPWTIRAVDAALPFPHSHPTEDVSGGLSLPLTPAHDLALFESTRSVVGPAYELDPGIELTFPQQVWRFVHDLLVGQFGLITMALSYALAIVLPIVTTFFIVFSILEDSGYLSRLSVMVNRIFRLMGLSGKAVLPMILGLGCDTMATMTTRILDNRRERLITTLLLALAVPCSAQLGVLLAMMTRLSLAGAAFWIALMITVLLSVGWLTARMLPGERSDFILEIPPMRRPQAVNVLTKTAARLEWYLREVIPLFALGTGILFLLDRLGLLDLIAAAGRPLVTSWLGLPEQTVGAFLIGFMRRDFGAVYLLDAAMGPDPLLSPHQVLVSMVTITLFMPCVATLFMIAKEHGRRTALVMTLFIFPFAFLVGGLVHRLGGALGL